MNSLELNINNMNSSDINYKSFKNAKLDCTDENCFKSMSVKNQNRKQSPKYDRSSTFDLLSTTNYNSRNSLTKNNWNISSRNS